MRRLARLLAVLCSLWACPAIAVPTYVCTNTSVDAANLNALLTKVTSINVYVHYIGQCDITTSINVPAYAIFYGDGPMYVNAPDVAGQTRQTAQGLPGTAQQSVLSNAPSSALIADPIAMQTNPFNLINVQADNVVVKDMSLIGSWNVYATVNTPGTPANTGSGVWCHENNGTVFNTDNSVASIGGATFDRVDVRYSGGTAVNFTAGKDCTLSNSNTYMSWHAASYASNGSYGMYYINNLFELASQANLYGASGAYWDMVGWASNHYKGILYRNTFHGGDSLAGNAPNTQQMGGYDFSINNYWDNTSTVPTCFTVGFSGTPVLNQQLTFAVTMKRPSGASVVAPYVYNVTYADTQAKDILASVLMNASAAQNANPIYVNGVALQTLSWSQLNSTTFPHVMQWNLAGNLACTVKVVVTDNGTPPLKQNPGTNGNGSGGGITRNGSIGQVWDAYNYIYHSRNYGITSGGANVSVHIIGNVVDGAAVAGYKTGGGVDDGECTGCQLGVYFINNKFISPNNECSVTDCNTNPTINGIDTSVKSKCGVWKVQGMPVPNEVLTIIQGTPGASPATIKYIYNVSATDLAATNKIYSVTYNIVSMLNGNPLIANGNSLYSLFQSANIHNTSFNIQFSFPSPIPCTETLSYTDSVVNNGVNNISIVNTTGSANDNVLGLVAFGNVGGIQNLPVFSPLYWGYNNVSGNYP